MSDGINAGFLATLIDRYGSGLALFAAQWTNCADDCVQEAFVELARQHRAPDQPVAWLYRVVKRRALNAARAAQRRQKHEIAAWRKRLLAEATASTYLDARAGGSSAELIDLLEQLKIEHREIVTLRIWSGLTFEEIASVLDLSASSAHRRYAEALVKLRELWVCEKTSQTIWPTS